MPIHIDDARINDIPELCRLLGLLFTQEAEFLPDAAKQSAALRLIIENSTSGRILVLRDGNALIGMVNLLYTISTACGGRVAIIEDMVVQPDKRNSGAGGVLLDGAIALAKASGCSRITLLTDCANNSAIRFYQRRGFSISTMLPLRLSFP